MVKWDQSTKHHMEMSLHYTGSEEVGGREEEGKGETKEERRSHTRVLNLPSQLL